MHRLLSGMCVKQREKGKRRQSWPPLLQVRPAGARSDFLREGACGTACWRMNGKGKQMRKKSEEAIRTAVEIYCLLLFVFLPLYMENGFAMIGDVKYRFFRNITIMFCILLSVLQFLWYAGGGKGERVRSVSRTDLFLLGYLAAAMLSFCFSMERGTALRGFSGWYMGLFSQLMFAWIYFVLSRWYVNVDKLLLFCFFGVLTVMALAVLNRYGFDPLGVFRGFGQDTWEAVHLVSTIGNPNWYCGYVSVAASACFYFSYTGGKHTGALGLAGCLLTFLTLLTQGSEGGYLIPLAMLAVLFVDAVGSRKRLLRFCLMALSCPAAALLGVQGIRLRGLTLAEDGSLQGLLFWKGWAVLFILLGAASLVLCFRERMKRKDHLKSGKARKTVLVIYGILAVLGLILFFLCQVSDAVWEALGERGLLRLTDNWGNDRGALWRMSWEYFARSPWYRKVFGAGPDCFYHAVYSVFAVNDVIHPVGQWEAAVYANAHNEWLNMLVNQGILGLVGYAGIFGAGFVRLWRNRERRKEAWWGLLAIAGYCVHGLVSFQQTVSTPLIFAILGITEAALRRIPDTAAEGTAPPGGESAQGN